MFTAELFTIYFRKSSCLLLSFRSYEARCGSKTESAEISRSLPLLRFVISYCCQEQVARTPQHYEQNRICISWKSREKSFQSRGLLARARGTRKAALSTWWTSSVQTCGLSRCSLTEIKFISTNHFENTFSFVSFFAAGTTSTWNRCQKPLIKCLGEIETAMTGIFRKT